MRIQFKRSILLAGGHTAEKGSIWDVPQVLALDLIAQESAVRCGFCRLIFLWATGVDVKPRALPAAGSGRSCNNESPGAKETKPMEAMRKTKRIRLTRSIMLIGGEAEEGEVRDLPVELADDLIQMDSAIACDDPVTNRTDPERAKAEMRKVKLLRSIVMGKAGEVHEVPIHVAYSLIDEESAEPDGWRVNPNEVAGWTS
jgi:hypothetical protein